MKNRHTPGMQLMLVEMVLATGFFAVIAAVCVSLFAAAWQTAADSRAETAAVAAAESAAECFKAAGGDMAKTAEYLGAENTADDTLTLCYDSDWEITAADGEYLLRLVTKHGENGLMLADITVAQGEETLFTLQAASAGEVLP